MRVDFAVTGGTLVTGAGRTRCDIGIKDGTVAYLGLEPVEAEERFDATGLLVMPGMIDSHTHFRDPGHPDKEDFTSGTRAAAVGGVTTVLEMPMADVGTDSRARLESRAEAVGSRAVVDFGLYGAAGQDNTDHIASLSDGGVVAFKSMLRPAYPGRERNFSGSIVTDDGALLLTAAAVARTGRTWCVHAENHGVIEALTAQFEAGGDLIGRPTGDDFFDARPALVEDEAVVKAIAFAEAAGARVHIVHITTAGAVRAVADARRRGLPVTAEACVPHLLLDDETGLGLGPLGKVSPRLRSREDVAALWEGLRQGWISTVASDHASYSRADLEQGWDRRGKAAAGGIASIEHLLPLLLTRCADGELSHERLVRVLSENPARIFGLWPRKGALMPGSDGDLIVVDPHAQDVIRQDDMQSKARHTVFDGWKVTGRVLLTVSRGEVVVRDGRVLREPGRGRFLRPTDPAHHDPLP